MNLIIGVACKVDNHDIEMWTLNGYSIIMPFCGHAHTLWVQGVHYHQDSDFYAGDLLSIDTESKTITIERRKYAEAHY